MDKVGFHYRSDTDHFSGKDLGQWLPRLKQLNASWIVLNTPLRRAIPEAFIATLKMEKIEPVLHFKITPSNLPDVGEILLLFENYRRWGVKYVILYDRANQKESWGPESWSQSNLAERFLDGFLALAEAAVAVGLVPVFGPLEPGGDYWDTIFLRSALDGIKRRASKPLQERLVLSAYARLNGKSLEWGSGGPESWPEAQPYFTPETSQDQCGFRIADWYLRISETVLERRLPILLLGVEGPAPEDVNLSDYLVTSARLIARQEIEGYKPMPEEVIGGAFLTLTGDESSSWFSMEGSPKPVVVAFTREDEEISSEGKVSDEFSISHYLLLPSFEWGVADWHLKVARPFIKRHRPTVGFSLEEAVKAKQVTVIGGEDQFPESDLAQLRGQGCQVRRIEGDGTNIASELADL